MSGTVRLKRDVAGDYPQRGLYASTSTGGVIDASPLMFRFNQDTTSFRSGGSYGEFVDNPREILSLNEVSNRFPYDHGNDFYTRKTTCKLSHPSVVLRSPYHNAWYQGPLVPFNPAFPGYIGANGAKFSLAVPSFDDTYGVKALRSTRPTKSSSDLSRLLAELILDLPRIPFDALSKSGPLNLRQLGAKGSSEYLNVVFGWQPTVSDWLRICKAVVYSSQIIDQFVRDSGRNVRRHLKFDAVDTTVSLADLTISESLSWPLIQSGAHLDLRKSSTGSAQSIGMSATKVTEKTSTSYWFSGAWTYWLDSDSDPIQAVRRYSRLADKVLGTGFDLELIWELAPWSWLSDWFVNIGDIISVNNALANDSLLLRYGYMTRKTTVERTYWNKGYQFLTGYLGPVTATITTKVTERVRATPYGFGLNTDAFTAQQWAILAALGMTGGDKRLRWL